MCKPKNISVPIEHIKNMADLVGNLDEMKNVPTSKEAYATLVLGMHNTLMDMLGSHVDLVYAPETPIIDVAKMAHIVSTLQ